MKLLHGYEGNGLHGAINTSLPDRQFLIPEFTPFEVIVSNVIIVMIWANIFAVITILIVISLRKLPPFLE